MDNQLQNLTLNFNVSAPGVFRKFNRPGTGQLRNRNQILHFNIYQSFQTLDQLRLENNRLREENLALLRVMDKIVKN